MDKEREKELAEIKQKSREISNKQTELSNELFTINTRRTELLQEKCRENIGRCFIKMKGDTIISYCRVIDIDKKELTRQGYSFNEYQYPTLWFKYPYDNSLDPFYTEQLFSGAWGDGHDHISKLNNISYKEISLDQFMEKFNEVNSLWIEQLKIK